MKNLTQKTIETIDNMISEEMDRVNETAEAMNEVYAVLNMSSDMVQVDTFLRTLSAMEV
jgi:hypothetical protein